MPRGKMIQRHIGRQHVKMEAEVGAMQPRAKECLGLPEAERSQEVSAPRGFGGNMTLLTP